jgi:hypothetical protein
MLRVFISYAALDHKIAEKVYQALEQAGIRAWLDNIEITPAADWLREVEQEVKASSHGLLLLSEAALRSPSAMGEFHQMVIDQKPVYVAVVGDLRDETLPYHLLNLPLHDLTEDFETNMAALIETMKANHISGSRPGASADDRDVTITLQANLRDLDTDQFVELVRRLADVGIKDIKVINVTAR